MEMIVERRVERPREKRDFLAIIPPTRSTTAVACGRLHFIMPPCVPCIFSIIFIMLSHLLMRAFISVSCFCT